MSYKFLKARIPADLYDALQNRAAVAGQRLGTYVRDVLERDAHAVTTSEALDRIESAISQRSPIQAPPSTPMLDHDTRIVLHEIRLLARELAMAQNAQIVARVVTQLKSQTTRPTF